MSLLDPFRQEYVRARVLDKYGSRNGNLAFVVEQEHTARRYHVEFRDGYEGPCLDNLYGLLKEPFGGKTEHLAHLVDEDDTVELTVSYSKTPFRQAYRIHSVSGPAGHKSAGKVAQLPYSSAKTNRY